MKFIRGSLVCLAVGMASAYTTVVHAQQRGTPPKTIKVILNVESQGPEGQWSQLGEDLTATELTEFRSLIAKNISGMADHELVGADYEDDALGIAVVVEKLQSGRNTYILVSSALTISKADKTELLLTHDVIAQPNIALAATSVLGQLVGFELRAMTGLLGNK